MGQAYWLSERVVCWVFDWKDCRERSDIVLVGRSTFMSQGTDRDLPADEENVLE